MNPFRLNYGLHRCQSITMAE